MLYDASRIVTMSSSIMVVIIVLKARVDRLREDLIGAGDDQLWTDSYNPTTTDWLLLLVRYFKGIIHSGCRRTRAVVIHLPLGNRFINQSFVKCNKHTTTVVVSWKGKRPLGN